MTRTARLSKTVWSASVNNGLEPFTSRGPSLLTSSDWQLMRVCTPLHDWSEPASNALLMTGQSRPLPALIGHPWESTPTNNQTELVISNMTLLFTSSDWSLMRVHTLINDQSELVNNSRITLMTGSVWSAIGVCTLRDGRSEQIIRGSGHQDCSAYWWPVPTGQFCV
jgi:hypothetical protein